MRDAYDVHLVEGDFMEDRLSRLERKAVEDEEISLGRAAEILRIGLEDMGELSSSWCHDPSRGCSSSTRACSSIPPERPHPHDRPLAALRR